MDKETLTKKLQEVVDYHGTITGEIHERQKLAEQLVGRAQLLQEQIKELEALDVAPDESDES